MKKIITELVNIKAINVDTIKLYTWASGIKSPVYIDNRLIMGYPQLRWAIIQEFAHIVHSKLAGIKIENIFGTATAGIPHAALLGHLLQLPFGYVRGSKKEHGKQNQIEGVYQSGQRVIVIEDLISTGGSAIEVVKTLQQAGLEVVAVIAIFNYQLKKAITAFNELQIPLYTLTTFDALVANIDILTSDQQIMLKQFHEQLNQ